MWLRIILKYFDQNNIPKEVLDNLHTTLQEESSFQVFIGKVTDYRPGAWHHFFPEILKLLKKFGLNIPKKGVMIEMMKEIVE